MGSPTCWRRIGVNKKDGEVSRPAGIEIVMSDRKGGDLRGNPRRNTICEMKNGQTDTNNAFPLLMTDFLLNCFVLGDDKERVFPVKIPRNDNVGILKDEIKKKQASGLDLWKVCLPIDNSASKQLQTGLPLRVNKRLSSLWNDNPSDDLHILVKAPCTSQPSFLHH